MKIGLKYIKEEISEILANYFVSNHSYKIDKKELISSITETKDFKNGDFCIPLFLISKKININPANLAKLLEEFLNINHLNKNDTEKIKSESYSVFDYLEKIQANGPYLNFWIDKKTIFNNLLNNNQENIFHEENLKNYNVVIDYSSCNIAKPYGIGHIMSTAIGESIKRCYEYLGANVIGINYIGDWGTQFGKVLLAFQMWGEEDKLEKEGVYYLYELYVKFHNEEEKDPTLTDKAKSVFQKLEDKDPYYYQLWERFRNISLENFDKYYKLFKNTFTLIECESKYGKKNIEEVIRILELNQILKDSEGAKVVFLDDIYPEENIPPCIIKKSDGTTTYAIRDIAAVLDRWQRFHFDEALYVINIGQQLHIKQFKGVLKKLNFPFANNIFHVAFGTMTFSGQKMQTRKGTILFLQDIYNEVYNQALELTKEKNIAKDMEDTAKKLAVAAIVFSILKNQRIKDIDFDFSKVLSFEGDTAAYLQYTAVRIKSILNKSSIEPMHILSSIDILKEKILKEKSSLADYFYQKLLDIEDKSAKEVVDQILFELFKFDQIIIDVIKEKEPYLLSRYLLKLAMLFNQFYTKVKVLEGENIDIALKLAFIDKIEKTIEKGLFLLGIEVPASL
ncbi:MAG TPA: arginine--tRNA ligase [Exilispira sp.]|mgnify:FL=1|nr:arginine--tRNA ligase [Exilispira sp.]